MRLGVVIATGLLSIFLLMSCESMDSVMEGADRVTGAANRATSVSSKAPSATGGVDFRSDEMLCSYTEEDSVSRNSFRAAKVLTPPSAQTQNQAEVLFADGEKMWSRLTLETHKPSKQEISVGELVLHIPNYSDDEDVSVETYRGQRWVFGRVTSTDPLFKDMVEVDGEELYLKWLRVTDEPVE